jgi:hypothetical protein
MVSHSILWLQHYINPLPSICFNVNYFLITFFRIWFEKILYTDDRLLLNNLEQESLSQQNESSEQQSSILEERKMLFYKFKAPAFLRKLTNTYFKKSQMKDLQDLKKRISSIKKKFRSQHNGSFNLEHYMHHKYKQ